MCYSFEIAYKNSNLVQDVDLTIEAMFDMMNNTYQVLEGKINLPNFYKETTKDIFLKYISITEGK